jgi:hypothetical protein
MPQAETGGGVLSWLRRLLRLPAAAPAADQGPDADAADDRAALQKLIERKRRNDFVRQREFDALRKIRSQAREQAGAAEFRPSAFQSSQSSRLDDRASTIQKINEIEAQMSSQWWSANPPPDAVNSRAHPMDWHQAPGDEDSIADFLTTPAPDRLTDLADTQPLRYGERDRQASSLHPVWTAPPWVDASAVASLQRALSWAPQPWVLDWSALTTLDVKAARALLGLFSLWADQAVQLRFIGDGVLRQRLKALTPAGRRDVEQLWWELRMAVLRVMNRPGEFEQVANDCCTLHEMPRLIWEPPRCECLSPGLS